ncbi:DNA repair protein RAD51 homolog 4 [Tripterygium wilfordii]|uniref:DNA repair protein RAD51 homolog 4 n=1 Tax=Tripterygium wilfordii TaxID=458696 RepID=UPI0018F80486|nr:DNA repair protein RAD51 homolog 4 [Tripterygium wilfordii]
MAPLKSLEKEHPILNSEFQNFCASHGIFSVEDLLMHDLYVLVALAEQQPASERLKEGITQVLSIMDGQHQPWMNGMELLQDAQRNKQILSTGCEGIDSFLLGGLREGQLTELAGPSSSGKTQFCLQFASNVAKKHSGCVIYLDTGNSFSPQRIAHFSGLSSDSTFNESRRSILRKVMSNIECHSVFNIFEMFDVLHQLDFDMRSQMRGVDLKARLLIVDSISSLISPILGGNGSHGRAMMTSAGALLKKLAHEHNIAVLVTNHTVGGEGGIPKPALGEIWKCIPHTRLLLSRDLDSNFCHISVLKHSSLVSFQILLLLMVYLNSLFLLKFY